MSDDRLTSLRGTQAPQPSADARKRAMAAGMAAFEAAKTEQREKITATAQGNRRPRRLTSIIASLKGNWIMDMRIPLGTAAVALILLPLGWQLYSTTSMTPGGQPVAEQRVAAEADAVATAPQPVVEMEAPALAEPASPAQSQLGEGAADSVQSLDQDAAGVAPIPISPMQAAPQMMMKRAEGDAMFAPPPAPMPTVVAQPTEPSGDVFTSFDESRLKVVAQEPVSTFSIDVDTASYSYVRRQIEDGYMPEPDAVRIEEMINYFPYDYEAPVAGEAPFKPTMAVFPTPWNPKTQLLHIGIKGYEPPIGEDKASNLVFLIDTSGSMDEPDKLPLLKRAFGLLVDQLSANDTVSIVVYAGSAGVVLEPTQATDKAKILGALDNLAAGGGTAGAEGIELAYRLADQAHIEGGTNRVILATDGDFNVGIADPDQLEDFIKQKRDSGVTLSVLGFGRGNLDDATMQALAQNGNGNASYISNFREAQKVLVEEGGSTLEMIAKDVKIQVEFNPATVAEYRLVGYETRALNREDFNNDAVDAGDIGAGHTVTAIYEITPVGAEAVDPLRYAPDTAAAGSGQELAFLKMRYKLPDEDVSQLIEMPVTPSLVHGNIADVNDDMRFASAVAAFGQKLKGSNYGVMRWADIRALAQSGRGKDESGYRAEFLQLLKTAELLRPDGE